MNLYQLLRLEKDLTPLQVESLWHLLNGHRCRTNGSALYRRLSLPLSLWRTAWYFDRLEVNEDGAASYCAGQDYPREITQIRNAILKG